MLILSRRVDQSVKIGDEVTVTVLGVKSGQVRLGFTAPRQIAVHREEVYERYVSAQCMPQQNHPIQRGGAWID